MFLVVECIQYKPKLIVVVDGLPTAEPGPNAPRVGIEAEANHVEILVCISDVSDRFLRDRRAIFGIALLKSLNFKHLASDCGIGVHTNEISEIRGLIHVRYV